MKNKSGKEILARYIPATGRYHCKYCGKDFYEGEFMVLHMYSTHKFKCHHEYDTDTIVKD